MGSKIKRGELSVSSALPALVSEWHPTKNGALTADDVSWGSARKIWWLCSKGHEWEASPNRRSRPHGCPVCAGQKLLVGLNDMATTHPELAAQWHPTKNGQLTPADVFASTGKKIWWECEQDHEYETSGKARVSKSSGCPYCARKLILVGFNDMATTHPELAAQWHPTKNGDLTPTHVFAGGGRKIWWMCSEGHEWEVSGNQRVNYSTGCPICSGKKIVSGVNDMATLRPDLAAQWHPIKNGDLSVNDISPWSNTKIWWRCSEGHEWLAAGNQRMSGTQCPVCAGSKMWPGFNDMATLRPDLAAQWHPTKNGDLTPADVLAGGAIRIWWVCEIGHEWEAPGNSRTSGRGCPICAGQKLLIGYNDMATTHPALVTEWHPTKNGNLTPADVFAGSGRKVWWICNQGHEWEAIGSSRTWGTGCPICATFGFDPSKPSVLYFLSHSEKNARKIGITNASTTRLRDFKRQGWAVLDTLEYPTGYLMREVERQILSWIRADLGLPAYLTEMDMRRLGGWSETFTMEGPSDNEVWLKVQTTFNELRPNY